MFAVEGVADVPWFDAAWLLLWGVLRLERCPVRMALLIGGVDLFVGGRLLLLLLLFEAEVADIAVGLFRAALSIAFTLGRCCCCCCCGGEDNASENPIKGSLPSRRSLFKNGLFLTDSFRDWIADDRTAFAPLSSARFRPRRSSANDQRIAPQSVRTRAMRVWSVQSAKGRKNLTTFQTR